MHGSRPRLPARPLSSKASGRAAPGTAPASAATSRSAAAIQILISRVSGSGYILTAGRQAANLSSLDNAEPRLHVGPVRRRRPDEVGIDDLLDQGLGVLGGEEPDADAPLRDPELLLLRALLEVARPLEDLQLLVDLLLRRGAQHLVGDLGGVAEVRAHPVGGLDQALDDLDRGLPVVPGQLLPHQDVAPELQAVVRRP